MHFLYTYQPFYLFWREY